MSRFVSIVLICFTGVFFSQIADARTLQIDDIRTIVDLSQPQIAPDGKKIVCVLSRPDYAANRYDSDLLLVDIATSRQRVITHHLQDVATPRWSPTGDRIAFIAREAGHPGMLQIFVLSLRTGALRKVSSAPTGVDTFAWRPDGAALAYDAADVPKNQKAIEQHHDEFEVGNDGYLINAAPTPVNLWLAPSGGGRAQRLTAGSGMVFGGDAGTLLSWSPDGKTLAYTWAPTPHLGDTNAAVSMLLDVGSGAIHRLTSHHGFENYPTYSPDGSKIAYWYPKNGDGLNGTEIYVTASTGGDGHDVTLGIDRDMSSVAWLPDGQNLLVSGPSGTSVALWVQPLHGAARRIDLGSVDPSWDNWTDVTVGRNGAIAFAGSEPTRPTELYYKSTPAAPLRRLTDLNQHIAALSLGKSTTITWNNEGFKEDGVLTYPPDFVMGKKYPLLLRIHGGPNYFGNKTFWDFIQIAAARGYLVFQPNYRGSDNLGSRYEHAIFNDSGAGPGRDVMAGVRAVEKLGIVDTSRLAVSGHSYGGFMSAWLASHDPVWKAEVLYAAELDPLAQLYLEDYNIAEWYYFKGLPWTHPSIMNDYRTQSPLSYVANVTAPTLILSNSGDGRVPITAEFAWAQALREKGVPVKFVLFPDTGHDISGPVHVEDMYQLWFDWLAKYLG